MGASVGRWIGKQCSMHPLDFFHDRVDKNTPHTLYKVMLNKMVPKKNIVLVIILIVHSTKLLNFDWSRAVQIILHRSTYLVSMETTCKRHVNGFMFTK